MKRILTTVLAVLFAAIALGAVTTTDTTTIALKRGATNVPPAPANLAQCLQRRAAAITEEAKTRTTGSATYSCVETRKSVATFTADPPPVVVPPPVVPPPVTPPSGDTITHGQAMTITGSGFGAKAPPLVYDDFEAGTGSLEGKAAVVGAWDSGDYCKGVSYATYEGRRVARHDFTNGRYNASLCKDPKPATATFYLDFWIKAVPLGGASRNWKSWRTYDAGGNNENGDLVYWCRGGGITIGDFRWLPEVAPPTEWVHIEAISTPTGTAHYRNGKPDLVSSGAGKTIGEIRIGHYWAHDAVDDCPSNPGANVYTDDVYVDTSVARVVLANASTFTASTKRAIQRPTGWANEAVTIIPNTRGFAPGETAYLIVIDAGNVEREVRKVTVR